MTPQTESQLFYDTLYPAVTFKSALLFSQNCLPTEWVSLCTEVGRVKMLITATLTLN